MMENLDLALFYDESFVEFTVKDMELNLFKKEIIIRTRGAWLDRHEQNVLREAKIFIKEWGAIKVSVTEDETKVFVPVNNIEEYILSDIIKFYYEQNILRLIGFGINGGWIEWKFVTPKISIEGNIE